VNGLLLNEENTEVLLAGTLPQLRKTTTPAVMFYGVTLTPKADITMLGVQLDKDLTMSSFVNAKIRTINYHIHVLRHLCPSLNIKVAETIPVGLLQRSPWKNFAGQSY